MMERTKFVLVFSLLVIALSIFPDACMVRGQGNSCAHSCGNSSIISPFRLSSDPIECGLSGYEFDCENNRTTLVTKHGKFFVENISDFNQTIRMVDASLNTSMCSIPQSSVLFDGPCWTMDPSFYGLNFMYVLKCNRPVNSSLYVDTSACTNSSTAPDTYFFLFNNQTEVSGFNESCSIEAQYPVLLSNTTNLSAYDIYHELLMGFDLPWIWFNFDSMTCIPVFTTGSEKVRIGALLRSMKYALETFLDSYLYYLLGGPHVTYNSYYPPNSTYTMILATTGTFIITRVLLGISILLVVVIYKLRRRHLSVDDNIEEFLQKQNNFMPIRYTYLEIKKMTGGFKDKLGQGGYGSVFKGKLRSGNYVAVKLLTMSKGNGQDFINEVATMGRIHHANIMPLIGFCVEGSKQALVYDFMPNGSLDKSIFSGESNTSLSRQKMFEIALGVARGIEYLHRGCEMQILHFDIKPHNILLDETFNPKVSDFGLAKLFPADDSVVCLTAVRGTIGYMAPELFYKNIGGISYKADVYSFGMLLMEMVGRRRNLNAYDQSSSSQIFFPTWIHGQLDEGEDIAVTLGDVSDDEKHFVKKMVIVSLWCIQMKPAMRPSMTKVLEMLENEVELLEMPPRPGFIPSALPTAQIVSENPAGQLTISLDPR